jgi:hypothetical protein
MEDVQLYVKQNLVDFLYASNSGKTWHEAPKHVLEYFIKTNPKLAKFMSERVILDQKLEKLMWDLSAEIDRLDGRQPIGYAFDVAQNITHYHYGYRCIAVENKHNARVLYKHPSSKEDDPVAYLVEQEDYDFFILNKDSIELEQNWILHDLYF